ncbi:MAG: type I DNA topoisomerase, partial [Oscillospiraceae bacterium]
TGMENPRTIDKDLVDAQQARRILDRLVGYKLSPFLWKKIRRGLSAGRVQSVAVRLIVDKEREIEAFVPQEYWNLDALVSNETGKKPFQARLTATADGEKLEVKNKEQSDEILKNLEGAKYTVTKITKGKRKRTPLPPFITSTMQQEASSRLGFTAMRTMRAAQTLYEGVDIKGMGTTGLITYMRTDSLRLSDEAVNGAREYIEKKYGNQYIYTEKRVYKSKSATAAQDGHEAVRPSIPSLTPDEVDKSINGDTAKLYRLIWNRFMASQMTDCLQDTMNVEITANDYIFKANGFNVTFDGYTVLYEDVKEDSEKKETALPIVEKGEQLKLKELTAEQKFTQPPNRYTEATLIKALEENGIGRPSTYAPIITTITDRDYVERNQKKLSPTALGLITNDLMQEQFPNIVDVKFSAQMEANLDIIENGNANWRKTIGEFYVDFDKSLQAAEEKMKDQHLEVPVEETDEICELCGRNMVIKTGRYGKFLACPGFPECKNTKKIVTATLGTCPKCGGKILVKKSKRGRVYYGCEKNPTCDFMSWDEPTDKICPQCGKTLFKKPGKTGLIYCATDGCDYTGILPAEDVEKE